MSELKDSPIITIERRKAFTVLIATVIMAVALGGGLMKVGSGFAARSTQGITVTGSAAGGNRAIILKREAIDSL